MKLIASIIALASANYNSHTLPQDVSEFTWADEANRDLFLAQEYVKEYVRYQAPDDEYVPIDDLPIVCKYHIFSFLTLAGKMTNKLVN